MDQQTTTPPKKQGGYGFVIFIFVLFALIVWFLPDITDVMKGNGSKFLDIFTKKDTTTDTNKTNTDQVTDKKNVTWFNNYVLPLYKVSLFAKKAVTATNLTDKDILQFAIINTAGTNPSNYQTTGVTADNVAVTYIVVPEADIKSIVKEYFNKTYTYQPATITEGQYAYYDSISKSYLTTIAAYVAPTTEKYDITKVTYSGYNITLDYSLSKTKATCTGEQSSDFEAMATGKIYLTYSSGDYYFKSSTYTDSNICTVTQ